MAPTVMANTPTATSKAAQKASTAAPQKKTWGTNGSSKGIAVGAYCGTFCFLCLFYLIFNANDDHKVPDDGGLKNIYIYICVAIAWMHIVSKTGHN